MRFGPLSSSHFKFIEERVTPSWFAGKGLTVMLWLLKQALKRTGEV
jgi:hypothetical protein